MRKRLEGHEVEGFGRSCNLKGQFDSLGYMPIHLRN